MSSVGPTVGDFLERKFFQNVPANLLLNLPSLTQFQLAPENGCLEEVFRFLLGRLPGRCELLVFRAGTYSIDPNS